MRMRGQQPRTTDRARVLRDGQTSAEDRLWSRLRGRRLGGLQFVRQSPIGPYFADFVCRERKIVVEVDGATHGSGAEIANDAQRAEYLARAGYRVFRAHNDDVYRNLDGVLESLLALADPDAVDASER